MIEVAMNFNEMKVAPVGVKSVEVNGVVLNETCELIKDMRSNFSTLTINNALSVNFKPSTSQKVTIHIVAAYKSISGETIIVHERSAGNIVNVLNEYGNSSNCPSSYSITIDNVDDFEYTTEVMTDIEKLQENMEKIAESLGKEIVDLKDENRKLNEKIESQSKEFKEFTGKIYKAFGIGAFNIDTGRIVANCLNGVIKTNNQ